MKVSNDSLIRFGVVVVVFFMIGFTVWVILKLRGDADKITKENVYEYLRK